MLNLQLPSPLQEIKDPLFEQKEIRLFMKREDLIHPVVSGNKWRKLKYNLLKAKAEGHTTVLSFGGAYSNHIHALALAAHSYGLKAIGVIRGEELLPLNETLSYAKSCDMKLHFVSREEYKRKNEVDFLSQLNKTFGPYYLIPEGGCNEEGVKGCAEIIDEIDITFDVICTACGTGTTMAGLIVSLPEHKKAIGFSALKGGDFLYAEINQLLSEENRKKKDNWQIQTAYHFGGYAKWNKDLLLFIESFEKKHAIQLDQIYTGKMMYGLYDLIAKDFFSKGATLVALHTGGLQGLVGLKN